MYILLLHVLISRIVNIGINSSVDSVSLSSSEYMLDEGSEEVIITINRSGDLLDDIIILFVARESQEDNNTGKRTFSLISKLSDIIELFAPLNFIKIYAKGV